MNTYTRAIKALARQLLIAKPDLQLSASGAVSHWPENLLAGINREWFEADLNSGDGNELAGKFRAAHSSSALAVNTFARFRPDCSALSVFGSSEFQTLQFEAKCPVGIGRGTSPNLDLLLRRKGVVIGIESKCTEHIRTHEPKFAEAYSKRIVDERRKSAWFSCMQQAIQEPLRYRYLDVAQLTKHAFGLAYNFPNDEVCLLYLFWEPSNASDFEEFRVHRDEVALFSSEVANSFPSFKAFSYRDLWATWDSLTSPSWIKEHLTNIRERYNTEI